MEQETRVALLGIVVSHRDHVAELNAILQEYGPYIIGRMGLPYAKRGVSIISLALDAPQDIISALSGKLGMLPHVSTKTTYAKIPE